MQKQSNKPVLIKNTWCCCFLEERSQGRARWFTRRDFWLMTPATAPSFSRRENENVLMNITGAGTPKLHLLAGTSEMLWCYEECASNWSHWLCEQRGECGNNMHVWRVGGWGQGGSHRHGNHKQGTYVMTGLNVWFLLLSEALWV